MHFYIDCGKSCLRLQGGFAKTYCSPRVVFQTEKAALTGIASDQHTFSDISPLGIHNRLQRAEPAKKKSAQCKESTA